MYDFSFYINQSQKANILHIKHDRFKIVYGTYMYSIPGAEIKWNVGSIVFKISSSIKKSPMQECYVWGILLKYLFHNP